MQEIVKTEKIVKTKRKRAISWGKNTVCDI